MSHALEERRGIRSLHDSDSDASLDGSDEESLLLGHRPTQNSPLTSPYQLPNSWLRRSARYAAYAATAREFLFTAYVYQSALKGVRILANDRLNRGALIAVHIVLAPLGLANLITDLTAVDWGVVDEFLYQDRDAQRSQWMLKAALLATAMLVSYPVGAFSDAIPLAPLMALINDPVARAVVKGITLGVIVFLGIIYYSMLTNRNIQRHASAFIDFLKKFKTSMQYIKEHSAAYLEVFLETTGNAGYRGITFGSFFFELLSFSGYYTVDINRTYIKVLAYTVAGTTAALTFFSRFLNVKDLYINEAFDKLTPDDLKKASGIRLSLIPELFFVLLRSAAVGILIYQALPSVFLLQFGVSLFSAAVVAGHSLYVRYMRLLYEDAVRKKSEEPVESRLQSVSGSMAQPPLLESHSINTVPEPIVRTPGQVIKLGSDLFKIAIKNYPGQNISIFVSVINWLTRLIRGLCFIAFFVSFMAGIGWHLTALSMGAFIVLW